MPSAVVSEATEAALTSLARGYAEASRMEESNAWRNPIDLIALLDDGLRRPPRRSLDARAHPLWPLGRQRHPPPHYPR
ncbi:MAG: hypothetical protein U0841_06345 [Chloroflexia bacterium]